VDLRQVDRRRLIVCGTLFGFMIGIWAVGFEKHQIIPLLVITPLPFLGGSFYSIKVLPPVWQTISLPGKLHGSSISPAQVETLSS
jgi:ABC-type multidrug transport system permease subunit